MLLVAIHQFLVDEGWTGFRLTVFRVVYSSGLGRLFWENFGPDGGRPRLIESNTFADHVNRLIAEADQELQQ